MHCFYASNVGLKDYVYTLTFTPYYIFVEMHLVFYDRIVLWLLLFQRIDECPPSLEDKYDQIIKIMFRQRVTVD